MIKQAALAAWPETNDLQSSFSVLNAPNGLNWYHCLNSCRPWSKTLGLGRLAMYLTPSHATK